MENHWGGGRDESRHSKVAEIERSGIFLRMIIRAEERRDLRNVESFLDNLLRHLLRNAVETSHLFDSGRLEAVEINHLANRGECLEDAVIHYLQRVLGT